VLPHAGGICRPPPAIHFPRSQRPQYPQRVAHPLPFHALRPQSHPDANRSLGSGRKPDAPDSLNTWFRHARGGLDHVHAFHDLRRRWHRGSCQSTARNPLVFRVRCDPSANTKILQGGPHLRLATYAERLISAWPRASLSWKADAAQQILEARVASQGIEPRLPLAVHQPSGMLFHRLVQPGERGILVA
jgi:hypothetical protein